MRHASRRLVAATLLLVVGAPASADTYADLDFLLLAPKVPSVQFPWYYGENGVNNYQGEGTLSDNLYFATRLTAGYEDCSCFGGRFRWFSFDNDVDYNGLWNTGAGTVAIFGQTSLDVDAFDFELTQRGNFGYWNLMGSAGLRYAEAEMMNININFPAIGAFIGGRAGVEFEGIGPTLALEGRRPVADTGVNLVAAGRAAILWGDVDTYSPFRNTNLFTLRDDTIQVWEFQLGVEYAHTFGNGLRAETGVFWETQQWDFTVSDLAFMGLGIHSGITY